MTFDNSFVLAQMTGPAEREFNQISAHLKSIRDSLESRTEGKKRSVLVVSFILSVAWFTAYLALYLVSRSSASATSSVWVMVLGAITLLLSELLAVAMIVDSLIQLSYFGTLIKYRGRLSQMQKRIDNANNSLSTSLDGFMQSRSAQWELPLDAGSSILEEADNISVKIAGMELVRSKFLPWARNILFFAVSIAWTAYGSLALFSPVFGIIGKIPAGLLYAAIVAACVVEIVLAKLVWGKTNCSVHHATLLISVIGPVLFLMTVAVAAVVVALVMSVLAIAATVAVVAIGLLCVVFVFGILAGLLSRK